MRRIAIVGGGPTGIYTLNSLLEQQTPVSVTLFEQADEAGIGMPYSDEDNSKIMLANIASIEIPPVNITYLEWLQQQSDEHLARYGIQRATLHDRQFLPRILLGEYFRAQFLQLVKRAKAQHFIVNIHESCRVTDIEATTKGVRIWAENSSDAGEFDLAVIATGHVWPDETQATRCYFPSPWSGLMEAKIPPCKVGIMGTSLSGLDAAMAVAIQHGKFTESANKQLRFHLNENSDNLELTLMSRTGVLPEADFYCPIPYESLTIVTAAAIEQEIAAGSQGLLNRIFRLIVAELEVADPAWCQSIALNTLDADSFATAWFAERKSHDPFLWAEANLQEVERNKRQKYTVPWRYTILRLHEVVQEIVPHLNEEDSQRFSKGLARVFIDNYAAIPSESIRRLLALHKAGLITVLALGNEYEMTVNETETVITTTECKYTFDLFIDARGQRPLKINDLPFPRLRKQLAASGEDIPDIGSDYTLQSPEIVRGRIAFAALPWLMHDRPFVQGLTACADIAESMAKAISQSAPSRRKYLIYTEE
ncbi:TPA: FAD-NAD(P)-binding protein [Escherichia fergusonii]|uniref:FAD-NAD(P)-binding protein n=1 Tax=Escherichia fergusonii TaxID=564 RepID=UPI0015E93FF6|nr:FAD-NAD(P)-binding protein [Escherichia fergusonii]MEB8047357.1 FAD-NAD(P)-binding protein [Escherichia fergusonii]MEB8051673.1 FAD-NAD(P)-binding protein [Escherichia fergusonii]QMF16339.1 FAD-NAD(P)-binding protein [Escherichia fergusonii]QMH58754.1 FAD-NAD(P)-binding protein [Escherichia fergusonii]HCO4391898.1 FAD-NAD(P)-binding protein [Escherichia fergusonii]